MMLAYAEPLQRIEQRYGVPGPVVVAIWGLETDFGAGLGGYSTFSALATLAYDCRRAQIYRAELIDALMLVQRGLLRPSQRGAWAGEIGQTQFMPSAYLKYAVNAQGGGGGDIISSPADALASTANFLRSKGWSPAPVGMKASRTSTLCFNGTRPRSTPKRSLCSRTSSRRSKSRRRRLAPIGLEHILIWAATRSRYGGGGGFGLWPCRIGRDTRDKPVVRRSAGKSSRCLRHRSRRLWTAH